jgi:ATP-dependent Clp protease adaptor protein ClpS
MSEASYYDTEMGTESEGGIATLPTRHRNPKILPPYHVVLLDDDDHTYAYVIKMLRELFGHTYESAYEISSEVDLMGRAVVDTTTKERAELKRDQIHAYGRDGLLDRCQGSMSAVIEPAVDA